MHYLLFWLGLMSKEFVKTSMARLPRSQQCSNMLNIARLDFLFLLAGALCLNYAVVFKLKEMSHAVAVNFIIHTIFVFVCCRN